MGTDLSGLNCLKTEVGTLTMFQWRVRGAYRGHLDNISNNLLLGAVNAFNDTPNSVKNAITGEYDSTPVMARAYRNSFAIINCVGDENYGESSSINEHTVMEPQSHGCESGGGKILY